MPTQQSVRALLSNSQRQSLFSGGRTSLSEDNPVIALGAGYYPIIQEGVNHARLDQQGPYGPLNFSRVAEQSGGQMSVSSGYFDMGGEPHKRQINLRGGITHTWYLNLTNQGLLQQQSILDIRRLFRMADKPAPDHITMMQAMHEVVGTMDETPFGEMSLAGVPVETFDLWSILETPGLRYSNVWRQLRDVVNIIDEDHLVGGGTNDNPADRSVKRAMARHLIPDAAAGLAGGGGPSFNPTGQIPVANERTSLAALQMEFDTHAATYTNSLLSFINERMREGINRMDPNFSVTQQQGPDVAIDTSAVMPEEQAGAVTGGGGTPESQGLPQAIGSTGSMDYAINFMGQIHVGDVSNRTIVEGYQHGLSRGEIMTQERVNELIENNDAATMHSEIYNYYRDQAMPDWNSAIVELKRAAANSYNTAQRNLTPEQMRNPFGASTSPSHGVTPRGSHGRNPGQNVRGQLLNDLSTSTNAMLNNLPGLAANHANIEGARTATALVNHMLGTWHQHNGQTFQSLTINKDPLLSFTAFFEQFTQGRNLYLFNIQAFTEDMLQIQNGYALLNMLETAGAIQHGHVGETIFQMKAAELTRRTKGGRTSITIGRNTSIGSSGITSGRVGGASLSINIPERMEQEVIDNILTQMEPPRTSNHGAPPPRDLRLARVTRAAMGQQSQFNRQLWLTQYRYLRHGRYWPHLASLWAAPYMVRLRRA